VAEVRHDAVRHPFTRDLELPLAIRPDLREQNIDTINGGGFTAPAGWPVKGFWTTSFPVDAIGLPAT